MLQEPYGTCDLNGIPFIVSATHSRALTGAIFTAVFFSFLWKSNLVSPSASTFDCNRHLTRQDIKFTSSGCLLSIKWSKTWQCKNGIHIIPLPSIPNSSLCPVATIQHYFALVLATPWAPFFCFLTANGPTPVTAHFFTTTLNIWSAFWASIQQTIFPTASKGGRVTYAYQAGFLTISYNFMGIGSQMLTNATWHSHSLHSPVLLTLWPLAFMDTLYDFCIPFPITIFSHV